MLLYIGIAVMLLLTLLLVLGLAGLAKVTHMPDDFRVTRTVIIEAEPEVVFPLINDFRNWPEWSPWEHIDPTMVRTFGGADSGAGATYHWTGKKRAGEGLMTIEESTPHSRILIRLEFIRPFTSVNTTWFELSPDANGTRVLWGMEGKKNTMTKIWCIFMNMEEMIGKDFEKGLAALSEAARKSAG